MLVRSAEISCEQSRTGKKMNSYCKCSFSWCLDDIQKPDLGQKIHWWTPEKEFESSCLCLSVEVIVLDCTCFIASFFNSLYLHPEYYIN